MERLENGAQELKLLSPEQFMKSWVIFFVDTFLNKINIFSKIMYENNIISILSVNEKFIIEWWIN